LSKKSIPALFFLMLLFAMPFYFVLGASFALQYDTAVSGSISSAGEINSYRFAGTSGDVVLVRMSCPDWPYWDGHFDPQLRLYDLNGSEVQRNYGDTAAAIQCTLNETGDYLVQAQDNSGTQTASYGIIVCKLNNNPQTTPNIQFDNTVSGSLDFLGKVDSYKLSALAGDVVDIKITCSDWDGFFDSQIRLYSLNGSEVQRASGDLTAEISCTLNDTGVYSIIALNSGLGIRNPAYSLTASLLAGPVPSSLPILTPSPTSPSLGPTLLNISAPPTSLASIPTDAPTPTPISTRSNSPIPTPPLVTASIPSNSPTGSSYSPANPSSLSPQNSGNSAIPSSSNYALSIGIVLSILGLTAVGAFIVWNRFRRQPEKSTNVITIPLMANASSKLCSNYIFVSHVEEDSKVAVEIATRLEKAGYRTWYFERDKTLGKDYLVETRNAIMQSQAFMLLISPQSLPSRQVNIEVVRAHECNKPFFPILIDIVHDEIALHQPGWSEVLGATTAITIPKQGAAYAMPDIIKGLEDARIEKSDGPESRQG